MANEIEKRNEAFLIYQDENGIARVNVRFEGEDVWRVSIIPDPDRLATEKGKEIARNTDYKVLIGY